MVKITVELVSARTGQTKVLGTAIIANTGEGDESTGNYSVTLNGWNRKAWRRGKVLGFPRKRLGPWDLVFRALRETVGSRNP